MLTAMPTTLTKQVREWSRTSGAIFYTLVLFELPGEPGLKSVE